MFARKLTLFGKSPRLWQAEAAGTTLRVVTGTPNKLTQAEKEHGNFDLALDALRKGQLAKLRAGYVLDGAHGALVGLLGLESGSTIGLSPDGAVVWSVATDTQGLSMLRVRELATGKLLTERPLDPSLGGVHDLHVRSRNQAVFGTGARGVTLCDLAGTLTSFPALFASATNVYRMHGAGDRIVAVVQHDGAVFIDVNTGKLGARSPGATVAALSADGTVMVTSDREATELTVFDTSSGRERTRIALGQGRGVRTLAITADLVIAGGIWFRGANRHTTWAWSLHSGERVLTERFPDADSSDHGAAAFGAGGALIALAHVYGSVQVYDTSDGALRLFSGELGRTAKGTTLRASADGRWLLGYDHSGLLAVWDFTKLQQGEGVNELALSSAEDKKTAATAPPRVRLAAVKESVTEPATDGKITFPFGEHTIFQGSVAGGALYSSYVADVTTFVDFTSWPPRFTRRGQTVSTCARSAQGRWFVRDTAGLFLSDDFADPGTPLAAPFEPDRVGWLGESPIIFDRDGEIAPQVLMNGTWSAITGLSKADAPGDTSALQLADGTPLITYRGSAYRVDSAQHAERVFKVDPPVAAEAIILRDGRIAFRGSGGGVTLTGPDRVPVSLPAGSKKHYVMHLVHGPRGALLATFGAGGGPNHTDLAGALIGLKGENTLLPKSLFGVDKKVVLCELFACADRILARVDFGNTFLVIAAPELTRRS